MRRLSLRGKPVAHRGGLPDLAKTHDSTTESTKTNDFKHTAQTRKRPGKVYAPEPSSNKKKKHRQTTPGGWSPPPEHEIVQLSDSDFQGEPDEEEEVEEEEDDEIVAARSVALKFDAKPVARTTEMKPQARPQKKLARDVDATFLVKSSRIAKDKAVRDYPHRYIKKSKRKSESADQESQLPVIAHYKEAKVDGETYLLGDCVHVNNDSGHDYLGRIIELFEKEDSSEWFTVQWFFRASETAMGDQGLNLDKQRVFFSELHDDNPLDCITEKKTVIRLPSETRFHKGARVIPPCDYFFDKGYKYAYATFYELPESLSGPGWIDRTDSDISTIENAIENGSSPISKSSSCHKSVKLDSQQCDRSETKTELQLLDLYSGCGAMSTGLCLGANLAGVNLITRWAVDYNEEACISLKHNHPETRVRKEAAEDFLTLLKEWKKLCDKFPESMDHDSQSSDESDVDTEPLEAGEYEVERLIGIRWVGDSKTDPEEEDDDEEGADESKLPNTSKKEQPELATNKGLEFKVKWKGYTEEENSWEPAASMDCPDLVKQFVIDGRRCKLLPLPGDVDVICGGPPCQGASGFNRFRNYEKPLDDPKNKQMVVYMDIVEFLRPRFILMENVVDILKFCDGILGRYALSRAVSMNYQAKIGLMVAGCYGLPQFRMRCFLFGACSDEVLPPFPLPTHSVIVRGGIPNQWERCLVAYDDKKQAPEWLQKPLVLKDAFSDLPAVDNFHDKDEMYYEEDPHTSFQRFVRLPKKGTGIGGPLSKNDKVVLPDHRPLCLNTDDYQRVCQIPKKKGANFRSLKGIIIKEDGITVDIVREPREYLSSGKPLVPDYAVSYMKGRSLKPFGRLWWDEIVPTVVTRAQPHNQEFVGQLDFWESQRATRPQFSPEPFDVGWLLHANIILPNGKTEVASTSGPLDAAPGLGNYVEGLFKKGGADFNVRLVQQNGEILEKPSRHVLLVDSTRIKLSKNRSTKVKEEYSSIVQLCGARGGGQAAARALYWVPNKGLSLMLVLESERERNAAIMLARRFACDQNVTLVGPDDELSMGKNTASAA